MYLALVYRLVQQKRGAQVCWYLYVMAPDILTHLSRHLKRHEKPFRCPECNDGFRYRKDLRRHQGSKHRSSSSNTKIYACPVAGCDFDTDRKDNCKRHVKKRHPMTLPYYIFLRSKVRLPRESVYGTAGYREPRPKPKLFSKSETHAL